MRARLRATTGDDDREDAWNECLCIYYIVSAPRAVASRVASRVWAVSTSREWVGKTLKPRAREGLGRERAQAWTKEPRVRA